MPPQSKIQEIIDLSLKIPNGEYKGSVTQAPLGFEDPLISNRLLADEYEIEREQSRGDSVHIVAVPYGLHVNLKEKKIDLYRNGYKWGLENKVLDGILLILHDFLSRQNDAPASVKDGAAFALKGGNSKEK